jgi:hypothetical protein
VISQIHRDFDQLSRLLTLQRPDESDLPRIERIVLYIDDLDRCPPRRVVEVLEAVHLILALPLFVVVIAVDPRWLQQSLSLHYAELLAATDAPRDRGIPGRAIDLDGQLQLGLDEMPALVEDDDDEWRPTPLNYLEKIIQIPFTLRPMTGRGVTSLVHGLLPIEAPPAEPAPEAPEAEVAADPGSAGTEGAGASGPADDDPHGTAAPAAEAAPPPSPAPSLSPRSLALTPDERDCAARIAGSLRTPRAVKKFTNLYRLVRAGLDEPSGRLDEFLAVGETDLPEYQAVQMLLAVIIAFPEEAPDLLRSFGDLDPDAAPNEASWEEHLGRLRRGAPADADPGRWREMVGALDASTRELPNGRTSTVEPFRRWGLEVARYSFSTGLRVFAREGHPGRSRERAPTR